MVFRDLKKVEEAPRFGKLIVIVEDSRMGFGQVMGVILPVDFGGLQSERR